MICAVDRGMVKGMLGALYGDTSPATESSPADRRRDLRHRRSPSSADPVARTTSTTPRPHRCGPRPGEAMVGGARTVVGRPRPHPRRGPDRPGRGRGRPASRSPRLLGARSREVVFTGGGDRGHRHRGPGRGRAGRSPGRAPPSSTPPCASRPRRSARSRVVGVDGQGRVDPQAVVAAVGPTPSVVHVQAGNHEVGTVQPVAEVVAALADRDVARARRRRRRPPATCPSTSRALGRRPAVGQRPQVRRTGRCRRPARAAGPAPRPPAGRRGPGAGPAGRPRERPGHRRVRGGVRRASTSTPRRSTARRLTDRVLRRCRPRPRVCRLRRPGRPAPPPGVPGRRRASSRRPCCSASIAAGVAVHSGSACSSEALEPSPVLEAMGVDAHRSLRVSVGWSTTDADVDALLEALPRVVGDLRRLGAG